MREEKDIQCKKTKQINAEKYAWENFRISVKKVEETPIDDITECVCNIHLYRSGNMDDMRIHMKCFEGQEGK